MRFAIPAMVLALFFTLPLHGGDDGLTGLWKFSIFEAGQQTSFWIVKIESKDNKLAITTEPLKGAPIVEVKDIKTAGDTFAFSMHGHVTQMKEKIKLQFDFEGKLPKPGAKRILGSFTFQGNTGPAILEATTAKNRFELERDTVMKAGADPKTLNTIFELLDSAAEKKASAKDVTDWVNTSLKAAEQFGPRFAALHQFRLLDSLLELPGYSSVAVEVARKSAKQFQVSTGPSLDAQLQLATMIDVILQKSEFKDDVKEFAPRLERLEIMAYNEHTKHPLDFTIVKPARKAASKRAVLVELFTGAQCPPCVAADLAFDGLEKTYASTDVVLLQYHEHIPRPDPLNNPDSDARYDFYAEAKKIRGTPSILFNGKADGSGGGFRDDAPDKYKEYCGIVNKLLDLPAVVQLGASATRTGDKIAIKAEVKDLKAPGDKLRLRLALVEDWARYRGSNGLQYHHRVVRAMPGGTRGFALKGKTADHAVEVDLEKERKRTHKFLDESYEGPRPMRLRDLRVVAFVQDDDTMEVFHAIEVPVVVKK
jgi:hypothetical protein